MDSGDRVRGDHGLRCRRFQGPPGRGRERQLRPCGDHAAVRR